jgi:hypothetical protein
LRMEHQVIKGNAPSSKCPVNNVTWYDAAAYCNWLSAQEGIPKDQWCYVPNDAGQYAEGMKVASNYLQRTGYFQSGGVRAFCQPLQLSAAAPPLQYRFSSGEDLFSLSPFDAVRDQGDHALGRRHREVRPAEVGRRADPTGRSQG